MVRAAGIWGAQPLTKIAGSGEGGHEGDRLRIYLDACWPNRLTDDQSQPRVREEADAIEYILRMVRQGLATWVSSTVLEVEIARNPDQERRNDVNSLFVFANEVVQPRTEDADRAPKFQDLGFSPFDAPALGVCGTRRRRRVSHD